MRGRDSFWYVHGSQTKVVCSNRPLNYACTKLHGKCTQTYNKSKQSQYNLPLQRGLCRMQIAKMDLSILQVLHKSAGQDLLVLSRLTWALAIALHVPLAHRARYT